MPQPRHADLRRFCEIDGWEETTGATGRSGDHRRYRTILADGTILRTKVLHGSGRIDDPDLWRLVWRDQLGLASEDQFWDVLRARKPVERAGTHPAPPSGPSIPAWVVAGLLRAGVPEEEIRRMTPDEAEHRLRGIWSSSPDDS